MAKKKQPQKELIEKTLTIRATTLEEIELLEGLKDITGAKTFTGAIFAAASQYISQISTLASLRMQVENLEKIKKQQEEVLRFMYHSHQMIQGYGNKHFPKGKFPEPELF